MPQTPLQTIQTDLLVWQAVLSGKQAYSSYVLDCTNKLGARLGFFYGLDNATAPTGCQFLVYSSGKATGNDCWHEEASIITPTVAATAFTIDGDQAAGTGAVGSPILTGTTVPVIGDKAFFKNGDDILNSEIKEIADRVTGGGNDSITLRWALTNGQKTGITYYTQAQKYVRYFDISNMRRLMVVVNNAYAASSPACCVRVSCVTFDSMQMV